MHGRLPNVAVHENVALNPTGVVLRSIDQQETVVLEIIKEHAHTVLQFKYVLNICLEMCKPSNLSKFEQCE